MEYIAYWNSNPNQSWEFKTNKTSLQWTPSSQIYLSNKKMILGQKIIGEQQNKKINYA